MVIDYERALYWKERELELILALDHARDSFGDGDDPQAMFNAIVTLLRLQFQADACGIALATEEGGQIDLIAADGMSVDDAAWLCQQSMDRSGTGPVKTDAWPYTIGIQIILRAYPLAGLVLARHAEPFSVEETGLLTIAESQIDSAVMQARTVWKLHERNRELEAIYQIDRLRDTTRRESDLVAGFTSIVLQAFEADFCLIALNAPGSGSLIIRGLVDGRELPEDAIRLIRERASEIQTPHVIATPRGIGDLVLLATPFLVGGERLGALVAGRREPYRASDHRLLYAMMSQMDSAIAYSRAARHNGGS